MELITYSRLRCLDTCARRHYYDFETLLTPVEEAEPLRFGRIYHVALDVLAIDGLDAACTAVYTNYEAVPSWADTFNWHIEREKVLRLLCGYAWYWSESDIEIIETERTFNLPIINPETGAASTLFRQAGRKDKKVWTSDRRKALMEHKTTKDDLAADSDYWSILRLDPQITMYFAADAELETIIYDVTRKPTIRPSQTKTFPKDFKVDFGVNGRWFGEPIEQHGQELPERETVSMYGARLAATIRAEPEKFYARQEVARMESDVAEFQRELWQKQQLLRYRQKNRLWPRNPGFNTCSWCPFKRPCFANVYPVADVPDGFYRRCIMHLELEENHAQSNYKPTEQTAAAETKTAECAINPAAAEQAT